MKKLKIFVKILWNQCQNLSNWWKKKEGDIISTNINYNKHYNFIFLIAC